MRIWIPSVSSQRMQFSNRFQNLSYVLGGGGKPVGSLVVNQGADLSGGGYIVFGARGADSVYSLPRWGITVDVDVPAAGSQRVVVACAHPSTGQRFELGFGATNTMYATGTTTVESDSTVSAGRHECIWSFNGAAIEFWVDGVLIGTQVFVLADYSPNSLYIGCASDGSSRKLESTIYQIDVGHDVDIWTFDQLGDAWWIDPVGDSATVSDAEQPPAINGGFETDTSGWTGSLGSTVSRITTDSYAGVACMQVLCTDATRFPYSASGAVYTVGNRYLGDTVRAKSEAGSSGNTSVLAGVVASVQGTATDVWQLLSIPERTVDYNWIRVYSYAETFSTFYDVVTPGTNLSITGIDAKGAGLNRCNDGRMEYAGVTAWTDSVAVSSKQVGTPYEGTQVLRVTDPGYTSQSTAVTNGHSHHITGVARGDGTSRPILYAGNAIVWTGTTSTSWQVIDVTFTAGGTALRLYTDGGAGGNYTEWDAIKVIDLDDPGGSIIQATATAQAWKDSTTEWIRYDGTADDGNSDLPYGAFDFLHDGSPWSLGAAFTLDALDTCLIANVASTSQFGFALLFEASGLVTVRIGRGTAGTYALITSSAAGVVSAGNPYIATASYAGSGNIKVYINGALVIDATPASLTAGLPSYPMHVGSRCSSALWFEGTHAEIMLRPSALTDAERAQVEGLLARRIASL